MKAYKIIIVLFFLPISLMAQQDPLYSFFRYGMNIINPAAVGSENTTELYLGVRSQWVGEEDAPETQIASFGAPIGKNVGLGVSILNDKTFIENQTWVALDFSYRIHLNDYYNLYLGLKGSANSYSANAGGLISYSNLNDMAIMDFEGQFSPNIGAGFLLKHEDYFLSFSIPRFLTSDRLQEENNDVYLGEDKMHIYAASGYNLDLNDNLSLETTLLYRQVASAPASIGITSILDVGLKFKLGATYRLEESFSGLFMFKVSQRMNFGYAYETNVQRDFRDIARSTHEIFFRLLM